MPIFEYRCKSCGDDFELFIRSSLTQVECPACGSREATKKFSTFGFSTGAKTFESAGSSSSSCGGCSSHNCSGCHH